MVEKHGDMVYYLSAFPLTKEAKEQIISNHNPITVLISENNFDADFPSSVKPTSVKPTSDFQHNIIYNNIINNNIKNNKEIYKENFEKFYKNYPRKVGKANVEKWFMKNKPNEELMKVILTSLEEHKKLKQWQDKQYIPYPSTWLNQKRWEDDLSKEVKVTETKNEMRYSDVGW